MLVTQLQREVSQRIHFQEVRLEREIIHLKLKLENSSSPAATTGRGNMKRSSNQCNAVSTAASGKPLASGGRISSSNTGELSNEIGGGELPARGRSSR